MVWEFFRIQLPSTEYVIVYLLMLAVSLIMTYHLVRSALQQHFNVSGFYIEKHESPAIFYTAIIIDGVVALTAFMIFLLGMLGAF